MMKKGLAMLMAVALMLSLSACGADENVRGTQTATTTTTEADTATTTTAPQGGEETTTTTEDEEATTTTTAPAEEEKELSLGLVDGLSYENEFIGIGCQLGSDWRFYSDEEIRAMNGLTEEILPEEMLETLKNATVIQDMFAAREDGLNNVSVSLEKADLLQLVTLDIEENYRAMMPIFVETYENAGYTDIEQTVGTAMIDGKEYPVLLLTANVGGVTMYQTMVNIKCNGYLASIAVTSVAENDCDEILACFYELD